jgi:hypothetical protein
MVPSLGPDGFGKPAGEAPDSYPGRLPDGSYLLVDGGIVQLRAQPGRRLGEWLVNSPGAGDTTLDQELRRAGATVADLRTPVLAVGSNASPAQLVHKFAGAGHVAIPVVRAQVFGLRLAFSAHINPAGYIPAGVRVALEADRPLRTWATFLDDGQLRVMDSTEQSYSRVSLVHPSGGSILELDSGEALESCDVYRTRRSVLDLEASGAAGLISQADLRQLIEDRCAAAALPSTWFRTDGARVLLADVVDIASSGLIVGDGLEALIGKGTPHYGSIGSSLTGGRGAG